MSLLAFVGSRATSIRNRLVDQLWERRLGVNTCGNVAIDEPGCHRYGTFSYSWLLKILDRLEWKQDDVFVDIGSGKGRVLCCAAQFKPARIIGIDLDGPLCEIARANVAHLPPGNTKIEVLQNYAQGYDYSQATKIFLFHPFNGVILKEVLASIQASLQQRPRVIELIYLNPVHDDVLEQAPEFERFDRWLATPWSGLKHDVSFWRAGHRAT